MSPLPGLEIEPLPDIDLRHMFVLSDDTGIFQHATLSTPDLHHGYCTDDNARSLIAAMKLWALPEEVWAGKDGQKHGRKDLLIASQRYLAFLAYAYNPDRGRYRNFMRYDRTWMEEIGSEDSHARTIWGLGKTVRFAPTDDIRNLAESLLLQSMGALESFRYLRPCAYSILGLEEYLRVQPDSEQTARLLEQMGGRLYDVWRDRAEDDWPWWEDNLTWGNAKLPHALLVAGLTLNREDMVEASLKALRWLLEIQTADDGHLSIIGNRGWYWRGQPRAMYDQQPIEAKALVQATLSAAAVTADRFWTDAAVQCFRWFTGFNDLGLSLYNEQTGGGHDGLHPHGVNANQGAESTLAYILSVLELHHYDRSAHGETRLASAPNRR